MAVLERPGFARLFSSLLYEGLVVFGILLVGFLIPQIVLAAFAQAALAKLLWVHLFLLLLLYFVWFWVNGGQTLAMKTWRLRIVGADGAPLRPLQAILRYMAAWLSTALLGAGVLWALVDSERQFLHDRIAGTRIVLEPRR